MRNSTVTVDKMFTLAAAAHRANNGRYINMETKNQENKTNKELMQELFEGKQEFLAEDTELGEKVRAHFNGLLFKKITGKLNGFEQTIAELLDQESVPQWKMGLFAALPSAYMRECKKENILENIVTLAAQSRHLPLDTKAKEMVVKILDSVQLKLYNCYTVTAVTDSGNLVGFYMKTDPKPLGTDYIKIRARVKNHGMYKRNVEITYLNYVKPVETKIKELVCDSQ
jgi:hypothetical protein